MKRLYYLADVLTLCEVIAGFALLGMAFTKAPAEYALWLFVFGELCDAFDGPCARRWKYPNDGKVRWWRVHVKTIEHLSDIFIAVACMIYLMFGSRPAITKGALQLGISIIVYCAATELLLHDKQLTSLQHDRLILIRRWIYAFVGLGGGIFLLIVATSWSPVIKFIAICAGLITGLVLLIYKLDRALHP